MMTAFMPLPASGEKADSLSKKTKIDLTQR